MTDPMRKYLDTLLLYYEEEIMGEAYFRAFAERLRDEQQALKMHLLADVERHAANAVVPLLTRYGLTPRSEESLFALGRSQAEQRLIDRDSALADMRRTFPGYVADFEALEAMAPPEDLPALQFLTEHEHAAIAFLEREWHQPQALTGAQPLTTYLNTPVPMVERAGGS